MRYQTEDDVSRGKRGNGVTASVGVMMEMESPPAYLKDDLLKVSSTGVVLGILVENVLMDANKVGQET